MQFQTWKKGLVFGALVGFLLTLFKREEREEVRNGSRKVKDQVKYVYTHPSETIHRLRMKLNQMNEGTDKVIEQLNQIEQFFEKRIDQSEQKQIEDNHQPEIEGNK
ncbi:hypothetical protein CEY16_14075 [Halalkalibacillus sediminis]|uniref:YtxH domain-containing protein n=1 Tax=Halalkalibacillus sediminis TaxID=2018042 RepID=A0A2I0QRI7_9BACI|nr:YtxH domain-containing protein [Halalkalibacillus sediminis]PKR76929.1 hypothetical protein CEY16_14075 [Halalkalibacillus sediminis]